MRIRVFNELGIYVLHLMEINNSILITRDIYDVLLNREDISEDMFLDIVSELYPEQLEKYKGILDSKENTYLLEDDDFDMFRNYILCIHISRKCNLQCKYCFGEEEYLPKQEISIEIAKKAIDFMVFYYGKDATMYTIDLSGSGEPLLRFDFIKELEVYCEYLRNSIGKKL